MVQNQSLPEKIFGADPDNSEMRYYGSVAKFFWA
jgi:hypothetical protein